jgi:hypothetical protein
MSIFNKHIKNTFACRGRQLCYRIKLIRTFSIVEMSNFNIILMTFPKFLSFLWEERDIEEGLKSLILPWHHFID